MRIRKQVYKLALEDFARCPIWEFALDEEGEEGQDEATVKPRADLSALNDCAEGGFVVAAQFSLNDGSQFTGYLYAGDDQDLGAAQPVIITDRGQIGFWHGIVRPKPDRLQEAYGLLARGPDCVFPARFRSLIAVNGKPMEGIIPGFLYLNDDFEPVEER